MGRETRSTESGSSSRGHERDRKRVKTERERRPRNFTVAECLKTVGPKRRIGPSTTCSTSGERHNSVGSKEEHHRQTHKQLPTFFLCLSQSVRPKKRLTDAQLLTFLLFCKARQGPGKDRGRKQPEQRKNDSAHERVRTRLCARLRISGTL